MGSIRIFAWGFKDNEQAILASQKCEFLQVDTDRGLVVMSKALSHMVEQQSNVSLCEQCDGVGEEMGKRDQNLGHITKLVFNC